MNLTDEFTNINCPDFTSHTQNALDALFPTTRPEALSDDDWAKVDLAAEVEYRACEGH